MKMESADMIKKLRGLAASILKELGTREGVKYKSEKFAPDGWGDKLDLEVDKTHVTVKFSPERSGGGFHQYFTGKVRIAVQEGWYDPGAKRFHERKEGFDFKAIVDCVVARAAFIKAKQEANKVAQDEQKVVRSQAGEINAALELERFRTDVYVVEEHRRLHVHVPDFKSPEQARAVAEFVRDLLKKDVDVDPET